MSKPSDPKEHKPEPEDKLVTLSKHVAVLHHHVRAQRRTIKSQASHIRRLSDHLASGGNPAMAAAPKVAGLAAQPGEEQVIAVVIECLRRNQIREVADADDKITADFNEAETADAATGNPHFRIQSFLHCLEDRLGWDPVISPSQLLNGSFATPRRIAKAALFHHP